MGYAGGIGIDPTYHNLGSHSETIQIDYDPSLISYEELLDVFWAENSAYVSVYSRQYNSIIFYHNEEQKELAEKSYAQRRTVKPDTVYTEIIPYTAFYPAEDYHQKYYLRSEKELMKSFAGLTSEEFVNSTAAARLNGFAGGYGNPDTLENDIDKLGLTEKGKDRLRDIIESGLSPGCPVP